METSLAKFEGKGITLEARVESDGAWITYEQTARLFGVALSTVTEHAAAIIKDSELTADTIRKFRMVRTEGPNEVIREIKHLNQDMVFHIGYRVKSDRGFEFRRWATSIITGDVVPYSRAALCVEEQALLMAQALVDQRRRLATVETSLARLEAKDAAREAEIESIASLPGPSVEAPPKTDGQSTVEIARKWAIGHGGAFREAFGILHKEIRYRLRIDLERREKAKKGKVRLSDIIDSSGKSAEIYAISCELFAVGKAA